MIIISKESNIIKLKLQYIYTYVLAITLVLRGHPNKFAYIVSAKETPRRLLHTLNSIDIYSDD